MPDPATAPVRVWDLPTRLFHALLAVAIIGSVASAKIGGSAMVWHMRLGLVVFALLAFRLVWGFVGGRWSRFGSFAYGPGSLGRYLRGRPLAGERFDIGHNPLGSLSVFALLAVLALQVACGLVADDEIANTGPLYRYASSATVSLATSWHKGWGQWLVIGLAALHVTAVLYYRYGRGTDLLRPMVSGDKTLPADTPASADSLSTRLLALALAGAAAALVIWVARLGNAGF